jgi:multidrug resistance efflux pump
MRKFGEYDMRKLSDSRLLYMRNPPKFAYIFTVIVIIIMIGAVVWSSTAVRSEQIQTGGIIITEDRHVIVAEISGTVFAVNFTEGRTVSEGAVIIKFDTADVDIELSKLNKQKDTLAERIKNLDKFFEEISKEDSNPRQPFKNVDDQSEFYVMFDQYLLDLRIYGTSIEGVDNVKYQTKSAVIKDKNASVANLDAVESDIARYNAALSRYDIKAIGSGTLHFDGVITPGVVIQAGTQIGSVSGPDNEKIIEAYVSSADRSKIDVGQECRFAVDGLAQTEYGSVKGKIKSISSDAIVQNGAVYFRVVVEFYPDHMADSKGNAVPLINGMTVRTWVTYEKITYLKYWMEQIGLGNYF